MSSAAEAVVRLSPKAAIEVIRMFFMVVNSTVKQTARGGRRAASCMCRFANLARGARANSGGREELRKD